MKLKSLANRGKDFFKKHSFETILFLVVLVSFVINYYMIRTGLNEEMGYSSEKKLLYKLAYVGMAVVLSLVTFFIVRHFKSKTNKLAKIFVVFGLIMGVFYLVLSPLFTGSDEHNHFYRIYEISEGTMVTPVGPTYSGSELPSSLNKAFLEGSGDNPRVKYHDVSDMMSIPLDEDDRVLYTSDDLQKFYANTSLYSPISYFPQVIGVSLGKVFNLGPLYLGMLGRLFNLLFYVLIGYFAIKMMPKWKLFYFLILLSPNMMQCATTLSADAFINVMALLLIAVVTKIRFDEKIITKGQELLLIVLCMIVSLCKVCYAPLVGLILLIRGKQYSHDKKEKIIYVTIVALIVGALSWWWMSETSVLFDAVYPHTALQREFILSNPLDYLIILVRSIVNWSVDITENLFIGHRMYHTQLEIPAIISFAYVGLVVMALCEKNDNKKKLSKNEKYYVGAIMSAVVALIFSALYLQYTAIAKVGAPLIKGIQGRYFIPVVFCVPLVLSIKKKIKLDEKKMIEAMAVANLVVWLYMMCRFIC